MIQSISPVWDETIVLPQSKIGELVVYARRSGNTWFLAAMNGLNKQTTIEVDLSFLKRGSYQLFFMKDNPTKQADGTTGSEKTNASSVLTINLNTYGGYVARFDKIS
ncbi:MAG: glycoside hydrolase family 97 C-terminal domain-containing protein [Niabella sp.]